MTDVEIAVGLRGEAGHHGGLPPSTVEVRTDDLADEVAGAVFLSRRAIRCGGDRLFASALSSLWRFGHTPPLERIEV